MPPGYFRIKLGTLSLALTKLVTVPYNFTDFFTEKKEIEGEKKEIEGEI